MRQLERKYPLELVVIGVHAAKFPEERRLEAVRAAVQRHGIAHPVVNDPDFLLWRQYAVRAWPTLFFIDPRGKIVARHEGEFPLSAFDRLISAMLGAYYAQGLIDARPLPLRREPVPAGPLRFPGKVLADAGRNRLFIADSGHHRVLMADLDGNVLLAFGGGEPGFQDGTLDGARFTYPQGLALAGNVLYVADTENHALRQVDLRSGQVSTVAGTGRPAAEEPSAGRARATDLSSPWDLCLLGEQLYIAMAGLHQIWVYDPAAERVAPVAGSGYEGLVDGPRAEAQFAQPSGIATDGQRLYVADSEASAVRRLDPAPGGQVTTLVGEGLFVFGDEDGPRDRARLQHPLGVAWHAGALLVADTFNHKIKRVTLDPPAVATVCGTGQPDLRDGPCPAAGFRQPGGLSVAAGRVYVADTDNHAVRVLALADGAVSTLTVRE